MREIDRILAGGKSRDFFSRMEMKNSDGPARKISLAGKLAAKRALLRALGKDRCVRLDRLEVLRSASDRPEIALSDTRLKKCVGSCRIALSISHVRDLAIACCVLNPKR